MPSKPHKQQDLGHDLHPPTVDPELSEDADNSEDEDEDEEEEEG